MTSPVKLPPLPSAVDTVRALFRGLPDHFTAQDSYYTQDQMRAYAEQAVREALATQTSVIADAPQPVAWRYWNEKSKSWNVTTSAVVADAMREFGRIVESLCAPPQTSADKDPPC